MTGVSDGTFRSTLSGIDKRPEARGELADMGQSVVIARCNDNQSRATCSIRRRGESGESTSLATNSLSDANHRERFVISNTETTTTTTPLPIQQILHLPLSPPKSSFLQPDLPQRDCRRRPTPRFSRCRYRPTIHDPDLAPGQPPEVPGRMHRSFRLIDIDRWAGEPKDLVRGGILVEQGSYVVPSRRRQ